MSATDQTQLKTGQTSTTATTNIEMQENPAELSQNFPKNFSQSQPELATLSCFAGDDVTEVTNEVAPSSPLRRRAVTRMLQEAELLSNVPYEHDLHRDSRSQLMEARSQLQLQEAVSQQQLQQLGENYGDASILQAPLAYRSTTDVQLPEYRPAPEYNFVMSQLTNVEAFAHAPVASQQHAGAYQPVVMANHPQQPFPVVRH